MEPLEFLRGHSPWSRLDADALRLVEDGLEIAYAPRGTRVLAWRRLTTAGAVASITTGSILTVVLIVLSPTVWVDILKYPSAPFPLRNPAIVSMSASILAGVVVSLLGREPSAEAKFDDEKLRAYLGVGAE